jgi:hypothetical protein
MTINAKTLVKDKFWIIESNGQKLGTLQKQADNGWVFLSKKDKTQVFHTKESLFSKFGFELFDEKINMDTHKDLDVDNFDVHGYPCSQHPYNPMFDVQKQLPVYTKTPKSKSQFCAADQLADSLSQVMTRMVTVQEEIIEALKTAKDAQTINIEMDGGEFKSE